MCRLLASLRLFVNDLELTLSLFSSLSLSLPPFFRGVFVTSVMCRCTFMRFAVPCVVINSLLSPLVGVRVFMIEVKHISFVYENFTFTIQCINFTFATYVVGERTYGVFLCSNKFHHHSFPAFWDTELRTNTCPKCCLAEN